MLCQAKADQRHHPAPGRYLGEVQSDGTVVHHPATVMTTAQARLLARPGVMVWKVSVRGQAADGRCC